MTTINPETVAGNVDDIEDSGEGSAAATETEPLTAPLKKKSRWSPHRNYYYFRKKEETCRRVQYAISCKHKVHRHLSNDADLLVPPPPPSLLDYISRAVAEKLPDEGPLNKEEHEVVQGMLLKNFEVTDGEKLGERKCGEITSDEKNPSNTITSTDPDVKYKSSKSNCERKRRRKRGRPKRDDIDVDLKRKSLDPEVITKIRMLPRLLYERFNLSALVAAGIAVEEVLTTMLMPLAQTCVEHCHSIGDEVSPGCVVTPGAAVARALSFSKQANTAKPLLASSFPASSKIIPEYKPNKLLYDSRLKSLKDGTKILEMKMSEKNRHRHIKSLRKWQEAHGYSCEEFKYVKSPVCLGQLLSPVKVIKMSRQKRKKASDVR